MRRRALALTVIIPTTVLVAVGILSIAGEAASDYSGAYYTTVGHEPRFLMTIHQTGSAVEFSLQGKGISVEGSGSVDGTSITLGADLGGGAPFSATITFAPDGASFQGSWDVILANPSSGTITGTTTPWPVHDPDVLGVPPFASADCTELGKIQKVSKLRSGEGHDYSDDFESCRSMKHYYLAKDGVERTSVTLFSPVTGTVIGTTDEWEGSLWKGVAIGVRPDGHAAFNIVIFHITLSPRLWPGDRVVAGQQLGTSAKQTGTVSDLALGVHTVHGYRLISLFEAMTDQVFAVYEERGVESRNDFIIPRHVRDADPLACNGEQFTYQGALEHWVTLEERHLPYGVRRRLYRTNP